MKKMLLEELRHNLRPELINRLDDIVIFRSLLRRDARKIVKLLVEELNGRLKEEKIKVVLDRKAVTYIVEESFNEEYGARPLRRFLQDKVENLLANFILENSKMFESGKEVVVKLGIKDGVINILKK
jgi:ATP-dependent Clp protease ATP-binding subunit ClpA